MSKRVRQSNIAIGESHHRVRASLTQCRLQLTAQITDMDRQSQLAWSRSHCLPEERRRRGEEGTGSKRFTNTLHNESGDDKMITRGESEMIAHWISYVFLLM